MDYIGRKFITLIFFLGNLTSFVSASELLVHDQQPLLEKNISYLSGGGESWVISVAAISVFLLLIYWNRRLTQKIKFTKTSELELQKFKDILDQTLDCIFIFDANTFKFQYVNDGAVNQIGYSINELKKMHPYDIKPNISKNDFKELISPLFLSEKSSLTFETIHSHKNGTLIEVEIFLQYIKSKSNYIAIVRNITERKEIEKNLIESEILHEKAQSIAKVGHCKFNHATGCVTGSKEFFKIFRLATEEITLKNLLMLVHPDDSDNNSFLIQQALKYGTSWEIELRIICRDGVEKWVYVKGEATKNIHGNVFELLGTVQDITIHKLMDVELEKSNSRFKAMFNALTDAVVYADSERKIRLVNHAALDLFGFDEDELFGKLTKVLYASEDEFNEQGIKRFNLLGETSNIPHITVYTDKNKQEFYGETLSAVVKSTRGEVMGYLGIIRDVSERLLMESELESYRDSLESQIEIRTNDLLKARDEAEQANLAKSKFLSNMSHELRTPLNAILGFGQIFAYQDDNLNEVQKSNIKEILDAGNHLLTLINEVLDLAQIESGKLEIVFESVDLTQLLQECLALMETSLVKMRIDVIDNTCEHGHFVKADFIRLKQVFLNIISNAVKYNAFAGTITLDCQLVSDNKIRISISDTGKGLVEDELSKLFIPFERLDAKDNIEGTGIGLTITKQLIELMHGAIGVESKKGQGCTFWVELNIF